MIGQVKENDFKINEIVNCYNSLIDNNFYEDREVLLNPIQYSPRFAASKEAIMTALLRQNYGYSHFIVGRDHSGAGNYGQKVRSLESIYDELKNDIDIKLIFFDEVYFCNEKKIITDSPNYNKADKMPISGTEVRKIINEKRQFEYPIIDKLVLDSLNIK